MEVMPAGVHASVGGGERQAGLLFERERVHVGAEQDAGAVSVSDGADQAALDDLARLVPHALEPLLDVGGRLGEVVAGLGVLVQPPAVGHKLLAQRAHFFYQGVHRGLLSSGHIRRPVRYGNDAVFRVRAHRPKGVRRG